MPTDSAIEQDRFARLLGVQHLQRSFDSATCRLVLRDEHCNALGGVHGGIIFSLADIAFAAACNAGEATYIGLQAEVRYLRTVEGDELLATAERVGASRKLAHYQVRVTDKSGNPVALFTSSAYRLTP